MKLGYLTVPSSETLDFGVEHANSIHNVFLSLSGRFKLTDVSVHSIIHRALMAANLPWQASMEAAIDKAGGFWLGDVNYLVDDHWGIRMHLELRE